MKKVLLSSVAALAVFALTSPVFAYDNNKGRTDGDYVEHVDTPATHDDVVKSWGAHEGAVSEGATKADVDANAAKGAKAGKTLKVDKGEAAKDKKAGEKAPAKALPNTAAVK